jgi:alpha-L-rhamnosidase
MKISKYSSGGSMVNILICIVMASFFCLSCGQRRAKSIEPVELKCEYCYNPFGIENNNPRLSWILNSDIPNQKQSAYRILVSSSEENLARNIGDLWDSHRISSDESVQIVYKGKAFSSGLRCWWKVRVWDKDKKKSDWSESASWEMGLLKPEDWKAKWISYECQSAPLFRKEFKITKKVKEARVYICGLGYYELHMNGSKIGEHVLDPAQTDYEQRTFYVVYDVKENINMGKNVVGIILGNGWYNQFAVNHGKYGWRDVIYGKPRLIFQMRLIYSDMTEMLITSDETWKGSSGSLLSDNVYAGEVYDARLEANGWDTPGFDDSNWNQVMISESPGFKHIIFKPNIINTLDFERAQYNSIHGTIKSELQNTVDKFRWLISIPANTTATAYIPAVSKDAISESGLPVSETEGVKFLRMEYGYAVLKIGSGKYEFIINKNIY